MPFSVEQFANYASSSIAGGAGGAGTFLAPGDLSMQVSAGQGTLFPATTNGPFRLVIGDPYGAHEIVLVTTRVSDTFTIVRGQEGDAPQNWAFGTPVQESFTAGSATAIWSRLTAPVYYADDYGAKGDGSTDDTLALQAMTDAARVAGGGTCLLRSNATYIVHLTVNPNVAGVSAALHLASNVTLDLNGATLKLGTNQAVDQQRMISNWNPQTSSTDAHIRIRNGIINGNALNQAGVGGLTQCDGIWLNYARDILVENIVAKNCYGNANTSPGEGRHILCRFCADVMYLNCLAYQDDGSNKTASGIAMYNCFNCQFVNCTVHDMFFSFGFTAYESSMVEMVNCSCYACAAGPGIQIEVCNQVTLSACQSGGSVLSYAQAGPIAASTNEAVKYGFEVFGCQHVQIADCVALNASITGFQLQDATTPAVTQNDVTLTGCTAGVSTSHGFATTGAGFDYHFVNCTAYSNTSRGFLIQHTGSTGQTKLTNCRAISNGTGFQIDATPLPFANMVNCEVQGNTTQATFAGVNVSKITGTLSAPAIPATTVAFANPFPFASTVHILGGTVTHINVDGTDVATATSATLPVTTRLPAGKSITLTYSVVPTSWVWVGD